MLKFYVVGHDNSARNLRRAHTRRPRFLRFGNDFVVRPKRRQEIAVALVLKHADAILDAIKKGIITLQTATDTNVTVSEFLAFCKSQNVVPAPVPQEDAQEPVSEETTSEGTEGLTEAPSAPTEPETPTEVETPPAVPETAETADPEPPPVVENTTPADLPPVTEEVLPTEEAVLPMAAPTEEKELPATKQSKKGRR